MEYHLFRDWPGDRAGAYQIVDALSPLIQFRPLAHEPRTIAAVETDYGVGGAVLYAAAVVMSYPECTELERAYHQGSVTFPYIPGLFFFREGPLIVETLAKLTGSVDLIVVNGHGRAHPRACGLASHVGYVFDRPTIGCARKLLTGSHPPLDDTRGSVQPIHIDGVEVGLALRSKEKVKPIYISPGHRCDLDGARRIIFNCLREYRLPEPLRVAHLLANRFRQRSERNSSPAENEDENE